MPTGQSKIVARIVSEAGIPQLLTVLSRDLAASDLQSLLLHVYQARAAALRPVDLMRKAGQGLVAPSHAPARLLNQFDGVAFDMAEGFDGVELAPAGPLGLSHVLGGIDQNNVLTTIRGVEVLGDSTSALALECSRRRKAGSGAVVRLCASHRVVRLQPFDVPGYSPHFRLFALVSAGPDTGSNAFEIQHLTEHIRFYLRLFEALNQIGFRFGSPLVEISDLALIEMLLAAQATAPEDVRQSIRAHRLGGSATFLAERGVMLPEAIEDPVAELSSSGPRVHLLALIKSAVVEPLRDEFPAAQFRFNLARLEGLGYYPGLCLRISPLAGDGNRYPVVDGGFTDWTARLLNNQKERFLASGMGSEFACLRYRDLGRA